MMILHGCGQYFAAERLFLFYLAVGAGQEVAEDFMASISLVSGDQSTSLRQANIINPVNFGMEQFQRIHKLHLNQTNKYF